MKLNFFIYQLSSIESFNYKEFDSDELRVKFIELRRSKVLFEHPYNKAFYKSKRVFKIYIRSKILFDDLYQFLNVACFIFNFITFFIIRFLRLCI